MLPSAGAYGYRTCPKSRSSNLTVYGCVCVRERSLFMQNSRPLKEMRQLHQYHGTYANNKK